MISVKEKKRGNQIFYQVHYIEGKYQELCYRTAREVINKHEWLLIYTPQMEPISEAFVFLNYTSIGQSIHTRMKSMYALKFLYSFEAVVKKDFLQWDLRDIKAFKWFLKGLSPQGTVWDFELITKRSNRTINGYLAIYRQYLRYLGNPEHILLKTAKLYLDISIKEWRPPTCFDSNEKSLRKSIEVPWYISLDEFQLIYNYVAEKYGLIERCIIGLMYLNGLRIGEVLGVTNDDIVEEKINGALLPILYLRNRISDKPYQKAKGCMNVIDTKQYKSRDYINYGYQKIILSEEIYQLLCECINNRYYAGTNKAQADRVRPNEPYEDNNFYIFTTRTGHALSGSVWNRRLREIFQACGIKIDTLIRTHNLNHRFRHGYAMYQVKYLRRNELELMHLLRHNSLNSVSCYFKPSLADQILLKQQFEEEMISQIPSLKWEAQL